MFCSRYNKNCEEAIALKCDVPSNNMDLEEQIQGCNNCVFSEGKSE